MPTDLAYDSNRPLYLSTGERLGIQQSRSAIERTYARGQPVLVYIHGRAKGVGEPKKSVNEGIYRDLDAYGVSTIGFTWDADDDGYDPSRPEASVPDFDRFLGALAELLSAPGAATPPRPALLAHSMGNLILSKLAKDGRLTADRGKLFSNIVLSSAAVKTPHHDHWLSKIAASAHVYVMVNPRDPVLRFAGFGPRPNMLGQDLRGPGVSPEQAVYVDLSDLNVGHRYFVVPGQEGQRNLRAFYTQVLTGKAVDLDSISDPASIDGVPVRRIRRN